MRPAKALATRPRSAASRMPLLREQVGAMRAYVQRLTIAVVSSGVAPFYDRWGQDNGRLVDAIRVVTDEQLKLRAAPDKWPMWAIAAHTAGARVYWLCGVFKESGAEHTPFTDPSSGVGGEDG